MLMAACVTFKCLQAPHLRYFANRSDQGFEVLASQASDQRGVPLNQTLSAPDTLPAKPLRIRRKCFRRAREIERESVGAWRGKRKIETAIRDPDTPLSRLITPGPANLHSAFCASRRRQPAISRD